MEKINLHKKKEVPEKRVDVSALLDRKNNLFNKIEEMSNEVDKEDITPLLNRIFEHSFDDGFKLAKNLNLSPYEIMDSLGRSQFLAKHPELTKGLRRELKSYKEKIYDQESVDKFIEKYDYFEEEKEKGNLDGVLETSSKLTSNNDKIDLVIKESDEIYSEYLRTKEIKSKELNRGDFRSAGERMAENNLVKLRRALEGHYYSGDVLNLVFSNFKNKYEEDIKKEANNHFKKNKYLQDNYIDFDHYYKFLKKDDPAEVKEIIKKILEKEGLTEEVIDDFNYKGLIPKSSVNSIRSKFDMEGDIYDKRFKNTEYRLPADTFRFENSIAKKQLIKEIENSLERTEESESKFISDEKIMDKMESFIEAGVNKAYIAQGLAGLDSPRSWQMRDEFIKEGVSKASIA